ncbi:MAG: PAS domain S-box protein [Spirochaetes bacterium]|nr:PAS domain S-box protein [Spirochaetota bacterium]
MDAFFVKNFDYCLFFCGVSFLLLASLIFPLERIKKGRLPWRYLGIFSILYGLTSWLEMVTLIADNPAFAAARFTLLASSFLFLMEFGRAGSVTVGFNAPQRWVIVVPAVLSLAGGYYGIAGLNAATRYLLGLTGGFWAALVFWRFRQWKGRSRNAFMATSGAMVLFGLALGVVPPPAPFPPATVLHEASFMSAAGFPIQFAQGLLAFITSTGFWIQNWTSRRGAAAGLRRSRDRREMLLVPLFCAGLAVGWWFTAHVSDMRESQERSILLALVKTAAAGVDAQRVSRLTGTAADLASPDYRVLKERLIEMRQAARNIHFYYLMRMAGGRAIFLVDSEPEGSPDYSPPGQLYEEQTQASMAAFKSETPVFIAPEKDRWGTWISVSSIIRTGDGRNVGLIGFDIDATEWRRSVQLVRLGSILASMFFSSLLILFYAAQRRNRDDRYALEDATGEQSLLLNTIKTHLWYLSSPETYGLANEAHAAFYGKAASEVSHRRVTEIIPEEEVRLWIEDNRKVFATGKRTEIDMWARDTRGEKRYLNIVKTPKLDEDGDVEYVVCSAEDNTEQKLMESALRLSEAQFRSYFELPLIGIAITSTDKTWVEVNDRLCEILGYSRQELLHMTWSEMTHPDDLAADLDQFNSILDGRIESYSMDKRFIRKSGEVIWTSLAAGCVRNADGTVDFFLALVQDISDQKKAIEDLHASEERYRLLAENSSDVIWTMTLDGHFQYVSPSITQLAGFTPEEALNIPLSSYILPEYLPPVMEELTRELRNPPDKRIRSKTMEVKQYARDGSVIDIEINANWIFDAKGEPVGIQGSTRDIRERKRAEAELRDREEALNAITASARDGIVMIDNEGNVSYWNESATRILGYEREEIIGKNLHEMLMPQRYQKSYRAAFPRFRETGEGAAVGKTIELAAIRKDGVEIPVDLSLSAMRLKDRWCAVGIIRDITERKQAEEARARSMEEKSVLLRELQHRVKNSMAMIVGLVELEANRDVGEDAKNALSTVRDRIMSLSNLYDLLYRSDEIKEVRLDQYLEKTCRSLIDSYSSGSARISLRMEMDEARIQVKSAIPIGLVVNEIITNSLKYAFPGGRTGTVGVTLRAAPGALSLVVYDDGVGLPAGFDEKQSKGMGSMLIELMVRQLKGSCEIGREKGTAYRITIPL